MNDSWAPPILPKAPEDYDASYFENVFFQLTRTLEDLKVEGQLRVGTVSLSDLPTSAMGLRPGDLYNDTGTLKIV